MNKTTHRTMHRIVAGLCCVLVIGVASAAVRSGVVVMAEAETEANVSAQEPLTSLLTHRLKATLECKLMPVRAPQSPRQRVLPRRLPLASAALNRAFAVSYARTKPSRIPRPISRPIYA